MQIEILFLLMGHMEILLNFDGESRLKSQSEFSHSVFSLFYFISIVPQVNFQAFKTFTFFNVVFSVILTEALWFMQQLLACIIKSQTNEGKISLLPILCQYL